MLSQKTILLYCAGLVLLAGVGISVYYSFYHDKNTTKSVVDVKITGPQATGQYVEVNSATAYASPTSFSSDSSIIAAGYDVPVHVNLFSTKKITQIAIEELRLNDLVAIGSCNIKDKDASFSTYAPGAIQMGYISFDLSCNTGITYTQESVLSTLGTFDGIKLLSYAGITPDNLTRSYNFDIALKFDDNTMTKKSFSGTISGSALWNGNFGAATISGEKDRF